MGVFAPGKLAISICQRCGFKHPYKEMREDGNIPGLYVCAECYDHIDPYKLPPALPDAFVLHHARPDLKISDVPTSITLFDGEILLTDTQDTFVP